jgi:uncharacterized protein YecE (DUF72 family)
MIRVGTSGYNYPEWRGSFYPEKFPSGKMLPYYAERFSTVEINYTFYRMPNAKTIAGWDAETPAGFSFTLKAPQPSRTSPACARSTSRCDISWTRRPRASWMREFRWRASVEWWPPSSASSRTTGRCRA